MLGFEATALIDSIAVDRFVVGEGIIDMNAYEAATGDLLIEMGAQASTQVSRANRTALRDWLSEGIEVRYGTEVVKVSKERGDFIIELDNGDVLYAVIVIATDGMCHSGKYCPLFSVYVVSIHGL